MCANDPVNAVDPLGLSDQGTGLAQYAQDVSWQGVGALKGTFWNFPRGILGFGGDMLLGLYVLSVDCGGGAFGAEAEADRHIQGVLTAMDDWGLRGTGLTSTPDSAERSELQVMRETAAAVFVAPIVGMRDQYLLSMEGRHFEAGQRGGEAYGAAALLGGQLADGQPFLNRSGGVADDMVTVTHRGTPESIAAKVSDGRLPANMPLPNNALTRALDHPRPAVWVSEGRPTLWNKMLSGMVGRRGSASVSFKVPRSEVLRPAGWLKRWYGGSQRVIEHDVRIPSDASIDIPGGN